MEREISNMKAKENEEKKEGKCGEFYDMKWKCQEKIVSIGNEEKKLRLKESRGKYQKNIKTLKNTQKIKLNQVEKRKMVVDWRKIDEEISNMKTKENEEKRKENEENSTM